MAGGAVKSYSEIVGDGGSDVAGQVASLRGRISRRLSEVRHVVAVGSGKGGVGKSTLTFQLASVLRARGLKVGILDADLNGPCQARMAGLREAVFVPGPDGLVPPRSRDGIGVVSLGTVVPESEAVSFASVSRGESHTWRATREFALLGELLSSVAWGPIDVLLVDLPPGAERTVQYAEWLGKDASFVLVTIPSEVSRGVVARSAAALRATPNRVIGYVENMSGYWCAECSSVRPLFPASERGMLELECLGRVPFDPELAAACDRGEPLEASKGTGAMHALQDVADRLMAALEPAHQGVVSS